MVLQNLMLLEHQKPTPVTAANSAADFHTKGDHLTNEQIAVVIALRLGGLSFSEIQERTNVAIGTICYWTNPKERKRKRAQRKAPKKIASNVVTAFQTERCWW